MFKAIQRFVGQGRPGFVEKLNELVDAVNFLRQLRGDETFIGVEGGLNGGLTVKLNINQVLSRIPKQFLVGIQLVKLANPTGSAGSNSTPSAPTYVYDISNPSTGTTLATAVSVLFARQLGHVTAGTWGLAGLVATTIGGTPAWQLYIVDEVYDAIEACS